VVAIQAGGNLINDYFDFMSGADQLNKELTEFSGGSRVLVDGLIEPRTIFYVSLLSWLTGLFAAAVLC
jgi:1,4-dihydroxy-2-naphthoate octaprenyltransferase